MKLCLANVLGKGQIQRVVCKQRNWQWIFPQNVTFFVSVTLSGLVRISKTRYRWKDLSLLTLLRIDLLIQLKAKCVQGGMYTSSHLGRTRPFAVRKG